MSKMGYVDCDGLSIAYRVTGNGPLDLIMVPGIYSHTELFHDFPQYADFIARLSEHMRVIEFDKRGQGLSDRVSDAPDFEERARDILAIVNELRIKHCVLFGLSEGAAMALLFAATYPNMVSQVITFGGYAKSCASDTYPHMPPREQRLIGIEKAIEEWGSGSNLGIFVPELADVDAARRLFGKIQRSSCSPSAMRKYFEMNLEIDIRAVLHSVHQPVLVMYHEGDPQVPTENSEYLASELPNANLVSCGPGGHYFWGQDNTRVVSEIENFLSEGATTPPVHERFLATVLFTDIVQSTDQLRTLGDRTWQATIDRHNSIAEELVGLYGGTIIKHTGDGILSTFDGPGRAVQCALALRGRLDELGLKVRAGVHTGEIQVMGKDVSGIAVNVASRIQDRAQPNQVLVSRTVRDLTIGNRSFALEDSGEHQLKGLDGTWALLEAI